MHNTLFKDIRHGKSYRFLKRGFLKIFLIHRQSFIIEMYIVFKINVLLSIVVVVLWLLWLFLLLPFGSLLYHRNVNSFLFYFILFYFSIHVCMAEEPPRESYAINYVCVFIKKPWIRALSIHFVIAAVVAHDRRERQKNRVQTSQDKRWQIEELLI